MYSERPPGQCAHKNQSSRYGTPRMIHRSSLSLLEAKQPPFPSCSLTGSLFYLVVCLVDLSDPTPILPPFCEPQWLQPEALFSIPVMLMDPKTSMFCDLWLVRLPPTPKPYLWKMRILPHPPCSQGVL